MAKNLPTFTTVGLVHIPKGWLVVRCVMSGDRAISRELVHDDPEPAPFAAARALAEMRRIYDAARAEMH